MPEREEHFATVSGPEALDALFERSADGPVVLFLHDYYCPVSFAAYDPTEVFGSTYDPVGDRFLIRTSAGIYSIRDAAKTASATD